MKPFFYCLLMLVSSIQFLQAATLQPPTIAVILDSLKVSISWSEVEAAESYQLFYAPHPFTGPETVVSVDLQGLLQFDATLWDGAAFLVAVKSVNGSELSDYSNIELIQISATPNNLPSSINMLDIPAGIFTMGNNFLQGPQAGQATEHQVSLSSYQMSETEISNTQYLEFLNAALALNLLDITTPSIGAEKDKQLIVGSNSSSYAGKVLYTLSGTRVMKDHNNFDGDNNEFTGVIEPENPLNIAYIGYDAGLHQFFLKDPHNITDFDWQQLCNYYNYTDQPHEDDPSLLLNDFSYWPELEGWSSANPELATSLPSKAAVAEYPVTFIRWWGAYAFADFYQLKLPSEAQWEYAAKANSSFLYAVYDGISTSDANWNSDGLHPATHHIRSVKSGNPNPFGLYNLGGNVWEWVADNYVSYSSDSVTDPVITVEDSTSRAWRGGSWNYHQATLESAARYYDDENRGNDHFGFRVVK